MLTRADVVEPPLSLIHQIGARFHDLFSIPGSTGDICPRTVHGLTFRDRAMENNDRRPKRVEIRFPRFAGDGTYHSPTAKIVIRGRTAYRSAGLFTVTKATRTRVFARLIAGRIHGRMRCRISG